MAGEQKVEAEVDARRHEIAAVLGEELDKNTLIALALALKPLTQDCTLQFSGGVTTVLPFVAATPK